MVCFSRIVWSYANDPFVDMREHFVIDPLIGKRSQLLLATQLCRMVGDFFLENFHFIDRFAGVEDQQCDHVGR